MSKILDTFLQENLKDLRDQGLYNEIEPVEGPNGPIIKIKGKDLINLSSNNYLGLATDEDLKKLAIAATTKYGVGAGAVRTINGTLDIHIELEKSLRNLKGQKLQFLINPASTVIWRQFQLL